jgi:hypothetical protein
MEFGVSTKMLLFVLALGFDRYAFDMAFLSLGRNMKECGLELHKGPHRYVGVRSERVSWEKDDQLAEKMACMDKNTCADGWNNKCFTSMLPQSRCNSRDCRGRSVGAHHLLCVAWVAPSTASAEWPFVMALRALFIGDVQSVLTSPLGLLDPRSYLKVFQFCTKYWALGGSTMLVWKIASLAVEYHRTVALIWKLVVKIWPVTLVAPLVLAVHYVTASFVLYNVKLRMTGGWMCICVAAVVLINSYVVVRALSLTFKSSQHRYFAVCAAGVTAVANLSGVMPMTSTAVAALLAATAVPVPPP